MTNAARIAAQQATEQQAALRQATEFQSKAIEQQAAVAAASVQEAARRHAESIAQAVAQQQMKLQTALTSSLIQAPPPHAQAPHAPPSFEAPASVAEGEPLDEKERREAERLAYEQREATRREAERKQWEEMERERREAERRAFAEQFESTRREFERQDALRRRELEHELRLQQERLLATLPLGHAVELAAPTAPTVPTSSCALLGQSSADASSVYASGSLGMLGHRQPPAPPPQAVAYNYALSAPGAEAGGASTGAVPGAYAAPPVMIVRPARRSRPSSATGSSSKRTKTPTRCTGSYRLAADSISNPIGGSSSHPSLTVPTTYEIGARMMHAGGVQYRAASMGSAVVFSAHQQPPEYLQLWMAPPRRPAKSPQLAPPIRSHRSADQIDPRLVGVRLIKPGVKPGTYRRPPRRPEPQIVFP